MRDKKITARQQAILFHTVYGRSYALKEISMLLGEGHAPSASTLRRDLAALCEVGFLA